MLHNLLIISGSGSIVLFRKSLSKALPQPPNLVAGLLSALSKLSTKNFNLPVSHIELESFAITVVDDCSDGVLRCVCFHDCDDGELFGRAIGTETLRLFRQDYSQTLASVALARTARVEALFKSFGTRIRLAIARAADAVLRQLRRFVRVATLIRHDELLCAPRPDAQIVADLRGLMHLADDCLRTATSVLQLGSTARITRLGLATLVVVDDDCNQQLVEIERAAHALRKLFALENALQGSAPVA